jgi:hypothetical protein
MSTRSQIEFQSSWINDKGKEIIDRRTVYRHWDGYPEAVIPDLKAFLKWNGGASVTEYTAANFIYFSKRRMEDENKIENPTATWEEMHDVKLGFGVCENDEIHSDIEFFYVVKSENKTIKIFVYKNEGSNLKLRNRNETKPFMTEEGV